MGLWRDKGNEPMSKNRGLLLVALLALLFTASAPSRAGEGASSNYFPGTFGDFAVAAAPEPGWIYANYNLFYSAEVDRTLLQGQVNTDLETSAYFNMSMGLYTFDKAVLGGRFALGAFVPLGYADLQATVAGPVLDMPRSTTARPPLGDIVPDACVVLLELG